MTAARKRAEAMARAAMPTLDERSEQFRESVIQGCMEEAAMLDAYFAHTWFVQTFPDGRVSHWANLKPEPIE